MQIVADFHIHSKYSRATSKFLDLEALDEAAHTKGVSVLGTGDFTHPLWYAELEKNLEPAEPGLYKRKNSPYNTRFVLTCEISSIYSKGGRVRRVHTLLLAPSLEVARKINKVLDGVGNLRSDGRPILGLDVKELARIALDASPDCMVIPAHAWTPWFSVFGSKSGFDSLKECFEDLTPHIYAIETGLSSDPPMNWRVSALDKITLISNSDCHSAPKILREANVFECNLDYFDIMDVIRKKDKKRFLYTIEFFPEEGKYHYDGHRLCKYCTKPLHKKNVRSSKVAEKKERLCPKCGRKITVGVLSRVEDLADRPIGFVPKNAISYKSLIPLSELIGEALDFGPLTKTVKKEYNRLIDVFGTEFEVLLNVDKKNLFSVTQYIIAESIIRMRDGKVNISPGYDGEYGKISIFSKKERKKIINT